MSTQPTPGHEFNGRFDERFAEYESASSTADELVIHGLIESRNRDTPESQSRRVILAIRAASATDVLPLRRPSPLLRIFAAAASLILAVGALGLLFSNTAQNADALVQASIANSATVGPRRYALVVTQEVGQAPREVGTLDLAPTDRMLLTTQAADGKGLIVGRNETGEWAVRPDGAVDRAEPRRAWPGWLHLADDALIASPEEVLVVLARDYDLKVSESIELNGRPQRVIVGTVRPMGPRRRPTEVSVCLDQSSLAVTRLDLRWSQAAIDEAKENIARMGDPGSRDRPPPRDRGPEGRASGSEVGGQPREGEEAGPSPEADRGGPLRKGDWTDRPPEFRPPPARRPDGPRPDGPRPDHPRTASGPGPDDGRRLNTSPQARPGRLPPPALLRFDVVAMPPFAPDWFDPAAHEPK